MSFPNPAEGGSIQSPMIYIKEEPAWEYKQLVRNLAKDHPPSEAELNALGKDGWELAGVFKDSPFVYFYFKRGATR
jgi:hypothetical protein